MFALLRYLLSLLRIFWMLCLWLWFLVCSFILLVTLLFPRLPDYRPQIEQWVSLALDQPITIGNLSTYWLDWKPTIAFQQVCLLETRSKNTVVEIARLEVTLNLFASLQQGQLFTSNIMVKGSQLTLIHHLNGRITLAGSPESAADNTWFLLWLLQQPALLLHASKVTWLEPKQSPFIFTNAQLMVQTQGEHHQLKGNIDLPRTAFQGMQANRLTFEMAVVRDHYRWQALQGQLALEQLQLAVPQGKLVLPYLEGQWLVTRQADESWQIHLKRLGALTFSSPQPQTGEKQATTALNLSPVTISLSPLPTGGVKVSGQLPVLVLDQLKPFLTLVKPELQKTINTMRGTFQNIEWLYTPHTWQLHCRFVDIALQGIEQLPTLQGASGQLDLDPNQGRLKVEQMAVTLDIPQWYKHPLSFKQLTGNLQWQRTKNTWQVSTQGVQLIDNDMQIQLVGTLTLPVPGSILESNLTVILHNGPFARLRYYVPDKFWPTLQLDGTLRTAQLLFQGPFQGPNHFELTGDVDNVSVKYGDEKHHTQIEVKELGGHLYLTPATGSIKLRQAAVTFNFPELYSHSLSLTQLAGDIKWEHINKQWRITTQKLQAVAQQMPLQVSGSVDIPTGKGVPYSNLKVTLRNGQLGRVAFYLSDKKLTKLVQWFNEAHLTGNISSAEAVLRGPVNALFDDRQSLFEFKANVNHAYINYEPGWPPLKEVDTTVLIKGHSLLITAQAGQLLESQIQTLQVAVPNLTAPVLNIEGSTRGPASDGLRFVDQSPLQKTVGIGEAMLEAKGQMDLHLKLTIPFSADKTQVQGKLSFKNNLLHKKSIGLTLTQVKGSLNFTNDSVSANNMQGKLFGKPVKFSLRTVTNRRSKRTRLQFTGKADPQFFRQLVQLHPEVAHLSIANYLTGTTRWQTTIEFPNDSTESEATTMLVTTDFLGMGINLPAPLGKSPDQPMPVSLNMRSFLSPQTSSHQDLPPVEKGKITLPPVAQGGLKEMWLIRLIYGNRFNSIVKVNPTGLERGTLILGTTEAQLPNQPILDIHGHIPTLSLTEWQPVVKQLKLNLDTSNSSHNPQSPAPLGPPIAVDIYLSQLEAVGQTFANLAIQANYTEAQWQAALTGKNIEGQVSYQAKPNTPSLSLMFNQLAFTLPPKNNQTTTSATTEPAKAEEPAPDSPDPRHLPLITFYCNTLRIGDINLGRVNLSTQPTPTGLDLLLESNATGLNTLAKVQWQYQVPRHQTEFQGSLSSDNTGKMLRHLGFSKPPLEGGLTQLNLNTHWLGTPYGFNLTSLTGRLSLLVLAGQIVDVEPGVGRLIGLFDVQALPRRLALDFSDVFGKGLGFASLVGFFSLQDGKAQTDSLMLQGPVAQVEIRGHTNLVAHNYDQLVIVTPHLSNTLPVAGTLAGGLGVGAVTLLMQQMLQAEVENPINYQYHILGSWDKPQIIPLSSTGVAKRR